MQANQIDLSGLGFPLTLRTGERVTDEELIAFSARNETFRVERNKEGEITVSPLVEWGGTHETYVGAELYSWTKQDGRGKAYVAGTGFNLPDGACLSPDAAWVPIERIKALTLAERKSFVPFCPGFLIEVRSFSDSRPLLEAKMRTWIECGTELAWLIDPIKQEVIIYAAGQQPVLLMKPDSVAGANPVDGFMLDMRPLWDDEF